MPNWSYNHLSITGKAGELKRFLTEGLYGYKPVYAPTSKFEEEENAKRPASQLTRTMNKIVPVPQDVLAKGYSDAGYYWQADNWGTKWDFCDMDDSGTEEKVKTAHDDEIKSLTYYYSTAWAPNEAWVMEATRQFPTLLFNLSYEEEAGFFAGRVAIKAGREIVRRDYADTIVYHIMEDNRDLKEIIEDRYYYYEEDNLKDFLTCVLEDFENALALDIVAEETITCVAKEVWEDLSDKKEEVA